MFKNKDSIAYTSLNLLSFIWLHWFADFSGTKEDEMRGSWGVAALQLDFMECSEKAIFLWNKSKNETGRCVKSYDLVLVKIGVQWLSVK